MTAKAILVGNVAKKTLKETKNGKNLLQVLLATDKKFLNAKGERMKETSWHNVNFFDKICDIANKYLHVGDQVYLEGSIRNTKVNTAKGEIYMYSVTVHEMQLLNNNKKKTEPDNVGNAVENLDPWSDDNPPF